MSATTHAEAAGIENTAIEMRGLTKRFDSVLAVDGLAWDFGAMLIVLALMLAVATELYPRLAE